MISEIFIFLFFSEQILSDLNTVDNISEKRGHILSNCHVCNNFLYSIHFFLTVLRVDLQAELMNLYILTIEFVMSKDFRKKKKKKDF